MDSFNTSPYIKNIDGIQEITEINQVISVNVTPAKKFGVSTTAEFAELMISTETFEQKLQRQSDGNYKPVDDIYKQDNKHFIDLPMKDLQKLKKAICDAIDRYQDK
jgi:hypothetical protein